MTFYRLFYPRQTCFLVASQEGKPNVTVVDWLMPVSLKPPMVAVALNNNSQSLDLLSHSKEFTLCSMPEKSKETAALIGATTGRLIDKVDEYNIALVKSRLVDAPLLKEALGSVECRVVQISSAGDHSVVIGEVVETHYPENDEESLPVLFNWGNKNYFGMVPAGPKDVFKEGRKKEQPPTVLEQAKEMKDVKDSEQKEKDAKETKEREQKEKDKAPKERDAPDKEPKEAPEKPAKGEEKEKPLKSDEKEKQTKS